MDFMNKSFLLDTPTAEKLYTEFADISTVPVLDYHCHIDPKEIYEDRKYDNITQLWLGGDHYKWRQMRTDGIAEKYITGDASDKEKFRAWAHTLQKLIGNPLYHWSHMELKYYFGYDGYLNEDTADYVWNLCSERLSSGDFGARDIIRRSNVRLICTTDDPADDLRWHELIKADDSFDVQVLPAFRPDRINGIEKEDFADYIKKLSASAGVLIKDLSTLKEAVIKRLDHFEANGCRVSDHSMDYVCFERVDERETESIFEKVLNGELPDETGVRKYRTYMMEFLAGQYSKRGWVMQLHYGVRRNANTAMFDMLGADTGFDCIRSGAPSGQLVDLLDALCVSGCLPKTVIYSLDPNDDRIIDSIMGCFQQEGIRSKIQHGSAWWFNDNLTGITQQMKAVASQSVLGDFIGMLTDSRSFLSYVRHDYFRRILCRMIGQWVEDGWYPYDEKRLGEIIKGISYNNAVDYFGFDLEKV
ncbi:MAG: glucuronate isomerase [Lachnospiraceae bacterium]|nr:glucuronate isomerase [Lachnospiraceae bacterium]